MAYYLTRFGTVTFPTIQPVTEMPTVPVMPGAVSTLGGGFDAWGSADAPTLFPLQIQYRVMVAEAVAATYMTTVEALRGLAHKRDYLYRAAQDGDVQRALARVERVSAIDSVETSNAIELTFDFAVWEPWGNNQDRNPRTWETVATWYFDTGLFWEASPVTAALTAGAATTVTVTNGGNVAVDDCTITIHAGDAAITAVTVAIAAQYVKWAWTGAGANPSIAIGKDLIIDCGALTVKDDSADAYLYFALDATHAIMPWLRLAPGANSVVVTLTGGGTGSTVNFDFPDRWA